MKSFPETILLLERATKLLIQARHWSPDKQWIGGTENGYWQEVGEAKLKFNQELDELLKLLPKRICPYCKTEIENESTYWEDHDTCGND